MSELITLADVLKSATEATSLESTDRILAFDANGNLKKISERSVVESFKQKDFQSAGTYWYSILETSASVLLGGILILTSGEWSGRPCTYTFSIGSRYADGSPQMPAIYSLLGPTSDVKLRGVIHDGVFRLDVRTYSRRVNASLIGTLPLSAITKDPSVPEGARVKEYSFVTSIDGGG